MKGCRTIIFAWRSTDPKQLLQVPDPIGPENDAHILKYAAQAEIIICVWGAGYGKVKNHSEQVQTSLLGLNRPIHCLKQATKGEPCHPLYLPYTLMPTLLSFSKVAHRSQVEAGADPVDS